MSLSGTLGIDITFARQAAASVRFTQPRAVPVSALLKGCTPDEAISRVGSLFALCGNAHATAAVSAVEAATSVLPALRVSQARLVLVAAEALREHFFRVAVDWPAHISEPPQTAALKPVTDLFSRLKMQLGSAIFKPSSIAAVNEAAANQVASALAAAVRAAVFGGDGSPLATSASIAAWAGNSETIAARMFASLNTVEAAEDLFQPEQTVFGRWRADPRLTGGEGSRRVLARILEIDALCNSLGSQTGREHACQLTTQVFGDSGHGASAGIDVARGRLHHELEIRDGLIAAYSISAPTGRNFEAGGAAEQAIARIRSADLAAFEQEAKLLVLEIDPCIAYELRVH